MKALFHRILHDVFYVVSLPFYTKLGGAITHLQVAQPVLARLVLRRVCLVRVERAKRWVLPWGTVPSDLEIFFDA